MLKGGRKGGKAEMAYEKRLCILKQIKMGFSADGAPLQGAVYCERLGSTLTVTPRIAGLAPVEGGRYMLAVQAGGRCFCFGLKGNGELRAENAPSVADGFSALLCFVKGEPEPVAFGRCGNAPEDFSPLLKAFGGECEREESPAPSGEPRSAAAGYDDEAIAETNFYGERENDPPAEELSEASAPQTAEPRDAHPFRLSRGGHTYYDRIAARLQAAFEKYPHDGALTAAIPRSEWVRTERGLLGIVYAEGAPRYLCVALKEEPPAEAQEAAMFVPVGPYSEEEGYYVVFQDADTGEYVKVERS